MGHIRDLSLPAMERQRGPYRYYFGRLLPQDREARIVEVGCGFGPFLHFLRGEGYQNVEGFDVSPQQVEAAGRLGIAGVTRGELSSYLASRGGLYDCVVAIDVVDHIPKDEVLDALRLVHESLKPGGRFLMQAVNGAAPFPGRLRYGDFTHEFAFTPNSVRQVLRAAGFKEIEVRGAPPYVHGIPSLLRRLIGCFAGVVMWAYMVAETGMLRGHIFSQNLIVAAEKRGAGAGG